MSKINYSKWDHIEVSDDEDDTHPNIDTGSLFRWRHQARVERMEKEDTEKAQFTKEKIAHKKKVAVLDEKLKVLKTSEVKSEDTKKLQSQLEKIKEQEEEFRKKEEEFAKKERLTPWNVDTLSQPGFEKTVINKPKEKPAEPNEDQKHNQLVSFIDKYEKDIKQFGMLKDSFASRDLLRDHPHLVCSDTASYLTMWCVNLQVEEKTALMERVAHQTIVLQYILELGRQLERDPRSCVLGFFERLRSADKVYTDAFEDELSSFIDRVKKRSRARVEEATRKVEEEQRKKRAGPGGLDPVEVLETLPDELKECFESRSIPKLQEVLSKMPKQVASYHMKRCEDSGLWVPDAKLAGLTPASEELDKLRADGEAPPEDNSADEEEFYDTIDDSPKDDVIEMENVITADKDDLGLD